MGADTVKGKEYTITDIVDIPLDLLQYSDSI
jgi:hypothetical protein